MFLKCLIVMSKAQTQFFSPAEHNLLIPKMYCATQGKTSRKLGETCPQRETTKGEDETTT